MVLFYCLRTLKKQIWEGKICKFVENFIIYEYVGFYWNVKLSTFCRYKFEIGYVQMIRQYKFRLLLDDYNPTE